jgi:hypothetical protein
MSLFTSDRILVAGSGRIAGYLFQRLRAADWPAKQIADALPPVRALDSADTLILADPLPGLDPLAARLEEIRARRTPRRPPLRVILVHCGAPDPALPRLPTDARATLETFDLEYQAARSCLARWPLHAGMDPPFGQTLHLLIAGTARPARALAVHALRLIHYGERMPVLTFCSPDPGAQRAEWEASFPQANQFCRLRFTMPEHPDLIDQPPVTGVYVCEDMPEHGLETARKLADLISAQQAVSPAIHLEVGEAEPAGSVADWDGQVMPFSWLRDACQPEVLLDHQGDELARVIHDHYQDSIAAQGRDPSEEPAGRPWEALPPSYRNANRHQADHLWAKLAVTDCRAVPEELVESFAFAPLEGERLAIIEHARWAADRYLDGWTYAPVRDNARKHHPQLIPYEQLSGPMKDLDRFAVRLAPTLLARSGRGIVRMLIVGIPPADATRKASNRLPPLADQALERLSRRYPDRSLVLASTLQDATSRVLVRRGIEHYAAGLFLLCPAPLPSTLAAQPDDDARRDLLELAARAERRIALGGESELARWLDRRAEITLAVGAATGEAGEGKRVRIDPEARELEWSFEY